MCIMGPRVKLSEAWKSPGIFFLKKCTNSGYCFDDIVIAFLSFPLEMDGGEMMGFEM